MKRPPTRRDARRRAPGNALLEFLLTLPIIIFVTGLTVYMSLAMLTKQRTLVEARHQLWHLAARGAQGAPRGSGEELARLRPEVEPPTLSATTEPLALDYWQRLWSELPGRHETHSKKSFQTRGRMWDFIDKTAEANHVRDANSWRFFDVDAWKIARDGPLREIYNAFRDGLQTSRCADQFRPTRDDIYNRWFHEKGFYDDEGGLERGNVVQDTGG